MQTPPHTPQGWIPEQSWGSGKRTETVRNLATSALDTPPVETMEIAGMRMARLPLGIPQSHIDQMMQAKLLDPDNIFDNPEKLKNVLINPTIPQVFGYTITDDIKPTRIITDPSVLKSVQKEVKKPTIFLGNHLARIAHAAYLGGRVPTKIEQINLWNKLPWTNVLEKATSAGLPFSGFFDAEHRKFYRVGDWMCPISSSETSSNHCFEGLILGREFHRAGKSWNHPEHGYSHFVIY